MLSYLFQCHHNDLCDLVYLYHLHFNHHTYHNLNYSLPHDQSSLPQHILSPAPLPLYYHDLSSVEYLYPHDYAYCYQTPTPDDPLLRSGMWMVSPSRSVIFTMISVTPATLSIPLLSILNAVSLLLFYFATCVLISAVLIVFGITTS